MSSDSASGSSAAGPGPALGNGLSNLARRVWARGTREVSEADEQLLREAADALLAVARHHPGCDLVVSLGHDGPAVRLHYTNEGLVVRGASGRRDGSEPTTGLDESAVATELASLLRAGEVET